MKPRTKAGILTGLALFSSGMLYILLVLLNNYIILPLGRLWRFFENEEMMLVVIPAGILLIAGLGVFCYYAYGELRRAAIWLPVASAVALFFATLCSAILSPLGAVLLFVSFACLVAAWVCALLDIRRRSKQ